MERGCHQFHHIPPFPGLNSTRGFPLIPWFFLCSEVLSLGDLLGTHPGVSDLRSGAKSFKFLVENTTTHRNTPHWPGRLAFGQDAVVSGCVTWESCVNGIGKRQIRLDRIRLDWIRVLDLDEMIR